MNLTRNKLKQMISEVLKEGYYDPAWASRRARHAAESAGPGLWTQLMKKLGGGSRPLTALEADAFKKKVAYHAAQDLVRAESMAKTKALIWKKLPFIGGIMVGTSLVLLANEAFAAEGVAGLKRVMSDPKNQEKMIEAIASLTGVGAAGVAYKGILDAQPPMQTKQAAFGGAAPESTRVGGGELGRNCWGTPGGDPEVEGRKTSAGTKRNFAHCSEIQESKKHTGMKITKQQLKKLVKEELGYTMQEESMPLDGEGGPNPVLVKALIKDVQTALQELTAGDYENAHETLKDVVEDLAGIANIEPIDTENPYYKKSTEGYL